MNFKVGNRVRVTYFPKKYTATIISIKDINLYEIEFDNKDIMSTLYCGQSLVLVNSFKDRIKFVKELL